MSVSGPTGTEPSTSTPTPGAAIEPVPPAEVPAEAGTASEAASGETSPPPSESSGPQIDPVYFQNSLKAAKSYDKDNNGQLNKAEYDALASESSGPRMAKWDDIPANLKNSNDSITLDTAASAHVISNSIYQIDRKDVGDAVKEFKSLNFDKDGSGTLTGEEFKNFAEHYGIKKDFEEVASLATVGKKQDGKSMVTQSDAVLSLLSERYERSSQVSQTLVDLATKLANSSPADYQKIVSDGQAQLRAQADSAPAGAAAVKSQALEIADRLSAVPGEIKAIPENVSNRLKEVAKAYLLSADEVTRETGQPATPQSAFDRLVQDNKYDEGWIEEEARFVANEVERAKAKEGAPPQTDQGFLAYAQQAVVDAERLKAVADAIGRAISGGSGGAGQSPAPSDTQN